MTTTLTMHEWEKYPDRMAVPGGWLYEDDGGTYTFVPDPTAPHCILHLAERLVEAKRAAGASGPCVDLDDIATLLGSDPRLVVHVLTLAGWERDEWNVFNPSESEEVSRG